MFCLLFFFCFSFVFCFVFVLFLFVFVIERQHTSACHLSFSLLHQPVPGSRSKAGERKTAEVWKRRTFSPAFSIVSLMHVVGVTCGGRGQKVSELRLD